MVKWIKNTLSVFNPLKLVNLGVFRGFRDDFLIETEREVAEGMTGSGSDVVGNGIVGDLLERY